MGSSSNSGPSPSDTVSRFLRNYAGTVGLGMKGESAKYSAYEGGKKGEASENERKGCCGAFEDDPVRTKAPMVRGDEAAVIGASQWDYVNEHKGSRRAECAPEAREEVRKRLRGEIADRREARDARHGLKRYRVLWSNRKNHGATWFFILNYTVRAEARVLYEPLRKLDAWPVEKCSVEAPR
ncbi:hypothetical protein KM043_003696 [Ampulex compressa]|nr:hypothetical protein KM043_003696 [Ampulex compressa]